MAPKWRFLSHPLQLLWFPPRLVPWLLLCSESLGFCGYRTRSGRRETKTAANHCRRGPPLPRSDCRPDCRAGGGFCCCWCRRGGKKTHIFAQFITRMHHYAKTGSWQTWEKLTKETMRFVQGWSTQIEAGGMSPAQAQAASFDFDDSPLGGRKRAF